MEIIPSQSKVSLCWDTLNTKSMSVSNSKQKLQDVYNDMHIDNENVWSSMEGNMKGAFSAMTQKTESMMQNVCSTLHNLSIAVDGLGQKTMNINLNAETQAGGKTNG